MLKKVLLISAAAIFAYTVAPAYANHVGGHQSVARGGIKALDERIWDLKQVNTDQNQAITDLEVENAAQAEDITDLEVENAAQAEDITDLEVENATQAEDITDLEVENAAQADAIDALTPGVNNIDCSVDSLKDAVAAAVPGDIFNVTGTCFERITISADNVIIDGGGSAILDGTSLGSSAVVRVQAIQVTIRNLTVQNGPRSGIHVQRAGSAIIRGTTIKDNGSNGILVNMSAYARIGPSSNDHPAAGTGTGNVIQNNVGHGILLRGSANADIFHNSITGNDRGIQISNAASADIDANVITGNDRGISLSSNGSVALSTDTNHYDTSPGLTSPENNLIEGNGIGFNCSVGGSATGHPQNFGGGNTTDTIVATSCAIANSLNIP